MDVINANYLQTQYANTAARAAADKTASSIGGISENSSNSLLENIKSMLERKEDAPWNLRDVRKWLKTNDDLM